MPCNFGAASNIYTIRGGYQFLDLNLKIVVYFKTAAIYRRSLYYFACLAGPQ